jgi:hypothetical protein
MDALEPRPDPIGIADLNKNETSAFMGLEREMYRYRKARRAVCWNSRFANGSRRTCIDLKRSWSSDVGATEVIFGSVGRSERLHV